MMENDQDSKSAVNNLVTTNHIQIPFLPLGGFVPEDCHGVLSATARPNYLQIDLKEFNVNHSNSILTGR